MNNPTAGTGNGVEMVLGDDQGYSSHGTHIQQLSSTFTSFNNLFQITNFDNGGFRFSTNAAQFFYAFPNGNTIFGTTTSDQAAVIQLKASTASNASIFFNGAAVDVSSGLANGMLWYNSTTHQLNFRDNATTFNLLAAGTFSSLTTTGTSGAATLSGGVLNIPNYAATLLDSYSDWIR